MERWFYFLHLKRFLREKRLQVLLRIPVKARDLTIHVGVSAHARAVEIQFLSPDQSCLDTALHNLFEKALKNFQAIAIPDFAERTMVRYSLTQVIADVPTVGKVQSDGFH